jgi:hypothetical protein
VKSKIIQEGFWSDISPMSESIETSEIWTGLGTRGSVSSQQESHASRSVVQGSKEARRMTVGSGRRCVELLSNRNPLTSLLKMLLVSSIWHSTRSVLTWKPKTTPRGRLYLELQVSMPRTEGKESGVSPNVWATPTVNDSKNSKYAYSRGDKTKPVLKLPGQVQMWPTPSANQYETKDLDKMLERRARCKESSGNGNGFGLTLANAARMWPTPTASDHKGSGEKIIRKDGKSRMDRLDYAVEQPLRRMYPTPTAPGPHPVGTIAEWGGTGNPFRKDPREMRVATGALNPTWVEGLMGYPKGWTCLDDGETDLGRTECRE